MSEIKKNVPYSVAVLVLGIVSIPTCFCYGVVGLAASIIAMVLAKKGKEAYLVNPEEFKEGSFKNLKAGRICAIIGLVLSTIYLIIVLISLAFYGSSVMELMDIANQMNQAAV